MSDDQAKGPHDIHGHVDKGPETELPLDLWELQTKEQPLGIWIVLSQ